MIRNIILSISACALFVMASGCVGGYATGEFRFHNEDPVEAVNQVPQRIAVLQFSGDPALATEATNLYRSGLFNTWFDIVELPDIPPDSKRLFVTLGVPIYEELLDYLEQMDVDGVLIGEVTRKQRKRDVRTDLQVLLLNLPEKEHVWAGQTHNPRSLLWNQDPNSSITKTVDKSLKLLRKDMKKLLKQKQKAEKKAAKAVDRDNKNP